VGGKRLEGERGKRGDGEEMRVRGREEREGGGEKEMDRFI
jgi:hypothetical protein